MIKIHTSQEVELQPQTNSLKRSFPKVIFILFSLFALYLVMPLVDVPLLGLSLSAPIFFVIAITCILRPPRPWFHAYRNWILISVLIWAGIFISTAANDLISGGATINSKSISLLIHFAYWMLVFVITTYFASQGDVLRRICHVLAWGVLGLAFIRWLEIVLFGNFGIQIRTHWLSQNSYGFLFSAFSPFLLLIILEEKGRKKIFGILGNLVLWTVIVINGSRGSWVSIAFGLTLCLIFLILSQPNKFASLAAIMVFIVGLIGFAWGAFPQVTSIIVERFNTFETLETDRSYLIRQLMIQKGLRLFEQSPLIGVGLGRFTKSFANLNLPEALTYANQSYFNDISAHNSYLDLLAESGLAGTVPFGILLITLTWMGFKSAYHSSRKRKYWILITYLSFIQMSVHMWVITSLANTANWFIYGLTAAAVIVSSKKDFPL